MKKLILSILIGLGLVSTVSTAANAAEIDELKAASAKVCSLLKSEDRAGFEAMLAKDRKGQMRWWWDSSGKGKYFNKNFSRCEFVNLDPKSEGTPKKKVFIQRYDLEGKPWGRPAPVYFVKEGTEWKIENYSL